MGGRWNLFRFDMQYALLVLLMLQLQSNNGSSLNTEGMALLKFRAMVEADPHDVFVNWNPDDTNPCNWRGIHCTDSKVEVLSLEDLSLGGGLAPALGDLSDLRVLELNGNNFSGVIPKEIGRLSKLELLDLRGNNLSGSIPTEIELLSVKRILLSGNKFHGAIPYSEEKQDLISASYFESSSLRSDVTEVSCMHRKVRHCIWQSGLRKMQANSLVELLGNKILKYVDKLSLSKSEGGFSRELEMKPKKYLPSYLDFSIMPNVQQTGNSALRRFLQDTGNLPAAAAAGTGSQNALLAVPSTGSGSFPAAIISAKKQFPKGIVPQDLLPISFPMPQTDSVSNKSEVHKRVGKWVNLIVLPCIVVFLGIIMSVLFICGRHGAAPIGPWRTGLSGELQKAFITGLPKLNRLEVEAACEDFSNIIFSYPEYTVFKGILSSGVEIALVSTVIKSKKDWSRHAQTQFRRKIDTLSRINHKNFVNLLGYCEENEPFMRIMVLEYAPNGNLHEHLHDKELGPLDWTARMRIIMGMAYCLQYMHHELKPPLSHPNLQSSSIVMTEDYAAKILDESVWKEVMKRKGTADYGVDYACSFVDLRSNVYSFGALLLEIISGKLPYSDKSGSILDWAAAYLDNKDIRSLVDPTIKSFKNNELDVICEIIQECTRNDPKKRPSMDSVVKKLRDVIQISPEAASPRLSPLWWAELEILSVEAT